MGKSGSPDIQAAEDKEMQRDGTAGGRGGVGEGDTSAMNYILLTRKPYS